MQNTRTNYRLSEICRTIQGEGFWTGQPCTLVRFQGCNLQCAFCDTPYALKEDGGEEVSLKELVNRVANIHKRGQMILLTGGEPMMQDISLAAKQFAWFGSVHLETNGTFPVKGVFDWVTVSPKEGVLDEGAVQRANEIKWLVKTKEDVRSLQTFLQHWQVTNSTAICVQPMSLGTQATQMAFEAAKKYGWRLSLQTHKLIGVK